MERVQSGVAFLSAPTRQGSVAAPQPPSAMHRANPRPSSFRAPPASASPGPGRFGFLVGLAAAVTACVDSAPATPRSQVMDSAGVTVVTNTRPAPDASPPWTLEPEPAVSIGLLEGDDPYLLSDVSGAVRFPDGRVAVANGGSSEIRFFDADGVHLRSVGGEGEGPGEFQTLGTFLRMPGDSLGIWDWQATRLTVFGPDGEVGRTLRMDQGEDVQLPFLQARLPDGSFLASQGLFFAAGELSDGLRRDSTSYWRFGPDGGSLGSVLSLPGSEMLVSSVGDGIRIQTVPFARGATIDAGPAGIVAGATDTYEIGVFDAEGSRTRLLRTEHPPRAVDETLRAAYEAEQLAGADGEEERASVREGFETLVYPPTLPAFGDLQVDALGNLWVEDYRLPWEEGPGTWLVYDPEGRILGAMELPAELEVFEIGEDYVLGLATDALEVERVVLYGLERGE